MDVFLEPAVIVSLVGSLFFALLARRLSRLGDYLLAHISLFPRIVRTRIRLVTWQYRRNLILTSRSQHKVTWAIIRTYTLLIFFVMVIALYLLLITIGPLKGIGTLPGSMKAFIASPIYIFEVLWLLQKEKAQTLIKVADKRVTKRSTGTKEALPLK